MGIFEGIRLIAGVALLIGGVAVFLIEVFGVYRFRYVLNRMHAAALGDTMGLTFSMTGLMLISGWNFTTLKMLFVIIFLWVSAPVTSHMLSKLEVETNGKLPEYCEIFDDEQSLAASVAQDAEKDRQEEAEGGSL